MMNLRPWDQEATCREQCELIAGLVRCQKPEIVVEAGTYRAHTASYIGEALEMNGYGHLHTADPYPHGQYAALTGMARVTFYPTDFLEMLDAIPHVDFAYIDASDHSRPGGADLRWKHFDAVLRKLRAGGIICVDDTLADDWNDGENGHSVDRIRTVSNVNFRFLRGLSVYYR